MTLGTLETLCTHQALYASLGAAGALIAAFVILLLASFLYFEYGNTPQATHILWGMNPVVIALVLVSCWRLGRTAITQKFHVIVALGVFAIIALFDASIVVTLALAGVVGMGWEWWQCRRKV